MPPHPHAPSNPYARRWHGALLAVAWVLLAVGCTRTPQAATNAEHAATQPIAGGSLSWGVESEPATLNPHLNTQAKVYLILRNSYESLLARDADGGLLPWLAASWQVSEDRRSITFKLRADVKFSDGSVLDAATVARNFAALNDPAYTAGTPHAAFAALIEQTQVVDPLTVQIRLKRVYAPFLGFAASLPLLSAAAFDSPQLKAGGPTIAGTGPFVLKSYQPGQQIRFERNPDYHWAPSTAGHQGPAYLQQLSYRFLPEPSVRIGALLSGQVQVIEGVPGQDAEALQQNPQYHYLHGLNIGTPYSLYFNASRAPASDVQVRRALIEGLDIDTLVQTIYRGQRSRAWGIASPLDPLYQPGLEHSYGKQAEQANALLDAAGWQQRDAEGFRSRQGKRLTLQLLDTPLLQRDQREILLLAIQAQARQTLGVELRYERIDIGLYFQRVLAGDYDVLANSTVDVDGHAIDNHYLPLGEGGFLNMNRVSPPALRQALEAAAASDDTAERRRQYAQAQNIILRQHYLTLPLYIPEDQIVATRQVHGLRFRPLHQLPENAYDVWVAP
jgi:peptide/nickel transport system substrate-binding protein